MEERQVHRLAIIRGCKGGFLPSTAICEHTRWTVARAAQETQRNRVLQEFRSLQIPIPSAVKDL